MTVRDMTSDSGGDIPNANSLDETPWLDLECPTELERQRVGDLLGETIPDEAGISEFEASSRFFVSKNAVHLRIFCLSERDDEITITPLGVLIGDTRLITVHWASVRSIRLGRERVRASKPESTEPWALALELFEPHVDTLADQIEVLYTQVDRQNTMLSKPDAALDTAIVNLGLAESSIVMKLSRARRNNANLS